MSLGKTGLIAPNEEIHTQTLIKPKQLDLDAQGEIDPNCPAIDSDGIARCRIYQPLVMFVGGAKDPEYGPVLKNTFPEYNRDNETHQDIGYGAWQTGPSLKALALHWLAKKQKVVFIGHSYGGDTVMDIARELSALDKELELVVTLDPVSHGGPRQDQLKPIGVKTWLNVYVNYQRYKENEELRNKRSNNSLFRPNNIARLGGIWGYCKHATTNYKFPDEYVDWDESGSGSEHAYAEYMFSLVQSHVEAIK